MEIGLCMIVKDEAKFIHSSLEGVVDQVDDVVVIDTGSTDGTLEILTNDFGLTPLDWRLDGENCYSKCAALNEGFSRLESDWVFILDADERIDAGELARVQALEDDPGVSGYFCAWNTHKGAEVIEDYKLCLFRKGIEKRGLIHDNAQFEIRTRNLRADWLPGLAIFPPSRRRQGRAEIRPLQGPPPLRHLARARLGPLSLVPGLHAFPRKPARPGG